jgi:hypothetical protein
MGGGGEEAFLHRGKERNRKGGEVFLHPCSSQLALDHQSIMLYKHPDLVVNGSTTLISRRVELES